MRGMLVTLGNLPYEAGKTYTGMNTFIVSAICLGRRNCCPGSALGTANEMLLGNKSRTDAKKIIILLTDGSTTKQNRLILRYLYLH